MSETPSDKWAVGAAYETYMGRWSRALAAAFLEWLRPAPRQHWLDVGCGTGSLTRAICERAEPASVVGCDPSAAFVEHARREITDERASFVVGGASALPTREAGFDFIASSLVLNFVPEPEKALVSMRERAHAGASVAACVWDYGDGVEFLRYFWHAVVGLDPNATSLDEARRFARWRPAVLEQLFRGSGFRDVGLELLEISTDFADFDDFWQPFLGGTGPAPAYVTSLEPARRELLMERVRKLLPAPTDGRIRLRARAFAVRGLAP
jgi:SAM-dependent methyltransferase